MFHHAALVIENTDEKYILPLSCDMIHAVIIQVFCIYLLTLITVIEKKNTVIICCGVNVTNTNTNLVVNFHLLFLVWRILKLRVFSIQYKIMKRHILNTNIQTSVFVCINNSITPFLLFNSLFLFCSLLLSAAVTTHLQSVGSCCYLILTLPYLTLI